MLESIKPYLLYIIVGIAVIALLFLVKAWLHRRTWQKKRKEMSMLRKRNEALNETLRNPQISLEEGTASGPMEVQWDAKAIDDRYADQATMMIELVEFSAYSRRKYIFPAGQIIRIGAGAENHLILPREGVSEKHCEIFLLNKTVAIRNISSEKVVLIRGKTSAFVNCDGVFLNNGDHIQLGTADIQFRCFKA